MGKDGFYVVVYDISDDKRRTRLHKRLIDYGTPVQYSVFECLLDEKSLVRMHQMIQRTIKVRYDHVRIYTLCQACLKDTWVSEAGQEVLHKRTSVVV